MEGPAGAFGEAGAVSPGNGNASAGLAAGAAGFVSPGNGNWSAVAGSEGAAAGGVHGFFLVGWQGAVVSGGGGGVYCARAPCSAAITQPPLTNAPIQSPFRCRTRFGIVSFIALQFSWTGSAADGFSHGAIERGPP